MDQYIQYKYIAEPTLADAIIYTMMENEIEQSDETWTDDFVMELYRRMKELEIVRLKVA